MDAFEDRERLGAAGLRATMPRLAVLGAVRAMPHSDAEGVYRALAAAHPSLSVQSVHNVLNDLSAAGLIRRIQPAHSPARYETRVDDNHHHVVCRDCGAIDDVECVVGHAPCLTPSAGSGFHVETAEVTFWGRCPDCAAAAAR